MDGRTVLDHFVGEGSRCTICGKRPEDKLALGCSHRLCLDCYAKYNTVLGHDCDVRCPNGCESSNLDLAKCTTATDPLSPEGENICNGQKENEESCLLVDLTNTRCSSCDSEDAVAIACCDECDGFLCDDCVDAHKKLRRLMKTHQVIPLADLVSGKEQFKQKVRRCKVHPEEKLSFFCRTCRASVCPRCVIIDHEKGQHDCVEINIAQRNFANEMTSLVAKCETKVQEMTAQLSRIEKEQREVNMEIDTLEQIINSTADAVIEAVNADRRKLLDECDAVKRTLLGKIKSIHDANQIAVDRLNSATGLIRSDDGNPGLTLEHSKADLFFQRVDEILARKPSDGQMEEIKEYTRRMGFRRTMSISEQTAFVGEFFQLSEWELSRQHDLTSAVSAMTVFPDGRLAIAPEDDDGLVVVLTNGSKERVLDGVNVKHIAALADGQFVIIDHENRLRAFSSEGKENLDFRYSRPEDVPDECVPVCLTEGYTPENILVAFSGVPACYAYSVSGGEPLTTYSTGTLCPQHLVVTRNEKQKIVAANAAEIIAVDMSGSVIWRIEEKQASSIRPVVTSDHVLIASLQLQGDDEEQDRKAVMLTIDRYTIEGELVDSLVQDERVFINDNNDSTKLQLIMLTKTKMAVSVGRHCMMFSGPQTLSDIAKDM
ncbi:uncharacterized protein [Diadema antillarum]|uniref:uncharacterized protein n=1 Tax=Diadema antillarum TaxID=105358 RepID=UPI003A87B192